MDEIIETTPAPEYGDLYLRFADEAQSIEVLEGYAGSIDVIGVIYNVDSTDPENPVATPLEGWHVNVRGPMMAALQEYAVEVNTPFRVWA